jgi:uncharacterized repeat protein (TIGR04052 family)
MTNTSPLMNLLKPVFTTALSASLALSALSCAEEESASSTEQQLSVIFHATSGDTHLTCGAPFALSDEVEPSLYVQDLRMFVHDIELKNTEGDWVPFSMKADGEWSDGVVTLLDFENGSADCDESGNSSMNHMIIGTLPSGDYEGLRFRVGVPYELNHQDVTSAEAPLNNSAMFWVWQRGYKFMRVELLEEQGEARQPWLFHLGSTGCQSEAATVAPDAPCAKTNAPWVTLEGFDPASQHVLFDVRGLLNNIDLTLNSEETPAGCMSMPSESMECAPVFKNLGLSYESGEVSACTSDECSEPFRVMNNSHSSSDDHTR